MRAPCGAAADAYVSQLRHAPCTAFLCVNVQSCYPGPRMQTIGNMHVLPAEGVVPPVAFLGFTNRIVQRLIVPDRPDTLTTSVLDLGDVFISPVYPVSLSDLTLVCAMYPCTLDTNVRLLLRSSDGTDVWSSEVAVQVYGNTDALTRSASMFSDTRWRLMPVPMCSSDAGPTILEPGPYPLLLEYGGHRYQIGLLRFGSRSVPDLTPDRRAAILSDPSAAKLVRTGLKCTECNTTLDVYAGLERSKEFELDGAIWYRSLPASWSCSCGKISFDATYMRDNLHFYLGKQMVGDAPQHIEPLYDRSALSALVTEFRALLDKCSDDELAIQRFMEQNPLLLSRFTPVRLFARPPILTRFKADFVVLAPGGELILIEIERPGAKLTQKGGAPSKFFNHAVNQVQDWLQVLDDHKEAALQSLATDLSSASVSNVRGVVILGRDASVTPTVLRSLKKRSLGGIEFLTFDDLVAGLNAVAAKMGTSRLLHVHQTT